MIVREQKSPLSSKQGEAGSGARSLRHLVLTGAMLGGLCMAFMASPPSIAQAQETTNADAPDTFELLDLFGEVFNRAREDYVEEVSDKELIEA